MVVLRYLVTVIRPMMYMNNNIRITPRMTNDSVVTLVNKLHDTSLSEVERVKYRNQIVEDNIGLVHYRIHKTYPLVQKLNPDLFEDLVNEGIIAIINGLEFYNPSKNNLVAYLVPCINRRIVDYYIKSKYLMTGSSSALLKLSHMTTYNSLPSRYYEGADALTELVDDSGSSVSAYDLIPSYDTTDDRLVIESFDKCLAKVLSNSKKLNEVHKFIIKLKFSTHLNMSNGEIGRLLGVSRQYVDALYQNAVAELRKNKEIKSYENTITK